MFNRNRNIRGSLSLAGVLAGVCLLSAGCGSEREPVDPKKVIPVTGIILIDGEAKPDVSVSFHPTVVDTKNFTASNGKTDETGRFHAWTYRVNDGIPPGDYNVTFYYPDPEGGGRNRPDLLDYQYTDAETSEYQLTVPEEGEVDMGTIELSM